MYNTGFPGFCEGEYCVKRIYTYCVLFSNENITMNAFHKINIVLSFVKKLRLHYVLSKIQDYKILYNKFKITQSEAHFVEKLRDDAELRVLT